MANQDLLSSATDIHKFGVASQQVSHERFTLPLCRVRGESAVHGVWYAALSCGSCLCKGSQRKRVPGWQFDSLPEVRQIPVFLAHCLYQSVPHQYFGYGPKAPVEAH